MLAEPANKKKPDRLELNFGNEHPLDDATEIINHGPERRLQILFAHLR